MTLPKRPQVERPRQDFEPLQARTFSPGGQQRHQQLSQGDEEQSHVASKIPWKIRAARKRQMKHHTTGMTKEEFAQIQKSLKESAVKCEY